LSKKFFVYGRLLAFTTTTLILVGSVPGYYGFSLDWSQSPWMRNENMIPVDKGVADSPAGDDA